MFPNVRAEMARNNFGQQDLINKLREKGFTMVVPTLSAKLNGKYEFSLAEAKAIKGVLGTDMPLEELFKKEGG